MAALGPVVLQGQHIRLEPLRAHHAAGLWEAGGRYPEIWTWLSAALTTPQEVRRFIEDALGAEREGREYAFAVIWKADGRVLGSTRYMNVRPLHRGVEVGWTWYIPPVWGSVVNVEAKFLLLRHAFEDWGAIRVELRTDSRNLRSQAAILKLGARREGVLRHERIRRDGTYRDTVVFSILDSEWPQVRDRLYARLRSATVPDLSPMA